MRPGSRGRSRRGPSARLAIGGRALLDRAFWANGTPVKLTRTEFDIVWLLMGSPNRVFTRHQLIEAVRGNEDAREEKTASTHVGNIRAKLKDTGTTCGIETVWESGSSCAHARGGGVGGTRTYG